MVESLEDPVEPTDRVLRALLASVISDPFAALVLADYLEERFDSTRQAQGELPKLALSSARHESGIHHPAVG